VGTTVTTLASTIPENGDLNPYGVAVVPRSSGGLRRGNVLVSNFNDADNAQGTGTTIVQVTPKGRVSTFATIDPAKLPGPCPGGVGLTTALVVLRSGWVIVGSLPTSDGTSATAKAGCLIVLDSWGKVRETLAGNGINGPWDMTADDRGGSVQLFVTNVLNGTVAASPATVNRGTVLRISLVIPQGRLPRRVGTTTIGSGFPQRTDPTALVIGPTGVGLAADGTLYVADTLDNRIAAIPNAVDRRTSAGTGRTVTSGGSLNGPLGLAVGPNHTILTVNGGDGYLVVTDACHCGRQVQKVLLDDQGTPPGVGALFGLAVKPRSHEVYFVDDNENTLNLLS
jgi:sugar lactone lactonase YvrE